MKKIFVLFILLAALLTLVGCNAEKELEPIEKAQAKVVEIGRQYLDYEITAAEAEEMLDSVKVPETESGKGTIYLSADRSALRFLIVKSDSTYAEIEEKVEWIASRDYTE